ncbi:hypothetical protein CPT_P15_011 [Pectobacterium phage vB_PcaP_P15_PC2B6]|uniref:Uncharacterized protein n=1 Tax=Pectobacterium phage vB_PcaP_P15_PC2B6 TaxID=2968434 RepID=A0AAX3BQB3_9CAUD|nr:hypothetical protein CPT_P15_011 [Pectobacterium phage vB_PcaP_P15_PC2B6]
MRLKILAWLINNDSLLADTFTGHAKPFPTIHNGGFNYASTLQ